MSWAPKPAPAPVEIDHARALAALGHMVKVVDKKTPAPVLRGVLIRHDGAHLRLTCSDLDTAAEAWFPTDAGGGAWSALVDASALHKVLQKTKGKADCARLEVTGSDDDGRDVVVTIGKTRITLESISAPSEFPTDGPLFNDSAFALGAAIVPRAALADVFTRPAFAISTEETRYYLGGLYLHLPDAYGRGGAESADDDGRYSLRAVATDGHRLARLDSEIRLPVMPGRLEESGQIVPRHAVQIIGKLLTARGAPDLAAVEFAPHACRVSLDGVAISAKAVAGTFPDYSRVIPSGDAHFALDRAELAEAVQAVQIVQDGRGCAIRLQIEESGGTASARGETGTAEQAFGAEIIADGEEITAGFNPDYLANVLQSFKSADQVDMTMTGAGDPARFEVSGDPLAVVVMPMRV